MSFMFCVSEQVVIFAVALLKVAKMPKKKGGKMGNMTEEERLLFLEQQRLAEEEMQKNKEDMLAQFLKVCNSWHLLLHGAPSNSLAN